MKSWHPQGAELRVWPMPNEVGSFALRQQGGAILALRSGFALFDFTTRELTPLPGPDFRHRAAAGGKRRRQSRPARRRRARCRRPLLERYVRRPAPRALRPGRRAIDREIPSPVRCPTMDCFGGKNLDTLFVTTSRNGRPAAELARQPDADKVFMVKIDVRGVEEPKFGG